VDDQKCFDQFFFSTCADPYSGSRLVPTPTPRFNNKIWAPIGLSAKNPPFIHTNCKPGQCVNYTRVDGWNRVTAQIPTSLPDGTPVNATGVRYAWASAPCCPLTDMTSTPCPPNSCPVQSFNSTLPAAPFIAQVRYLGQRREKEGGTAERAGADDGKGKGR
jgi:hypothetical protein